MTKLNKSNEPRQPLTHLPKMGFSSWRQIAPFVRVCREQWRQLGLKGKAPRPIKIGIKAVAYKNIEVHRWIENPLGYQADSEEC